MKSHVLALVLLVCLPTSFTVLVGAAEAEVQHAGEVAGAETAHDDAAGSHAADGHETAHASNTNVLSLDPDLAIFTAIVFLGLMAILWKFAWGPISEALTRREKEIADHIAQAQQKNEDARRLLEDHQNQLASAAAEVRQLIDNAKQEAETQKQGILAEAQAAAASEKDRAVREIDAAKNSALQSIAEKSVDTAVSLAGKIVNRTLSADDHSKLIHDALDQFPSKN